MLQETYQTLLDVGAFESKLPPIIERMLETVPNEAIPVRMKTVIAISELVTFSSQFRRNLWHWEGFELPINANSFIVAGSGEGKDSTVKAIRRAFKEAYDMIDNERKTIARTTAIRLATEAEEEMPEEWAVYKNYYSEPPPIYIAPTTPQGFIQHINDIGDCPIGAGSIYTGEIGDELASNGYMPELIKTISEIYDTGDKEMVYTKGAEHRSKEIKSMPLSSLFVGSPNYLIYDEVVKKKFILAFGSKLARRTFFCYTPYMLPRKRFTGPTAVKQRIAFKKKVTADAKSAQQKISAGTRQLAEYHIAKHNATIAISEEAYELFETYDMYNYEVAEAQSDKYPLSKLVRRHLQWKALKLAGALAIIDSADEVSQENFIDAIRICELLNDDMQLFEADLIKEPYEVFADYMKSVAEDSKATISLHELRKRGFIPTTGKPETRITELVKLASSYDPYGIFTACETGVCYEDIQPTTTSFGSFLKVDNTPVTNAIKHGLGKQAITDAKTTVASTAVSNYETMDLDFADLASLLTKDYAYSPFKFKDDTRGKDNVISGTKWVVLDIDTSTITAQEAHLLLSDINHHIALTSDQSNEFKFRILIELESIVDVDALTWKHFIVHLGESLSFKIDPVPQSQIFFSYAGREVLSVTDESPLPVKEHLLAAMEKAAAKPVMPKTLTSGQQNALLADELTTFDFAFESEDGSGSRNMMRAAYYAKDLGMPSAEIEELILRINDYWDYPMPSDRLEATVLSQIRRF